MGLGEKLRRARILVGITQRDLASRLKVSHSLIAKWETENQEPTVSLLFKIADALQLDVAALLMDDYEVTLRLNDPRSLRLLRTFEQLPDKVKDNVLQLIAMTADIAAQIEHESEPVESAGD